jgi:WD40 repeat protein
MLADLSADGKTLLFTEYGDSVGGAYDVYVRKGGGPPVRLGAGIAVALSPDGARALAILPEEKPRLVAYPREAGPSHVYPPAPVERIHWATFLPDGKNLLLAANASDRGVRLWVQSVEGGALRPVSEEGIRLAWPGIALSADGRRVAAIGPGRTISLYDLAGVEKVKVLPGLDPELAPVEFSPDGRTLFAHDYRSAPTRLYRIDVESGARTLAAELAPSDRAGLWAIPAVHVSADESVVAYSYIRTFSELYVVDGLK